jgi:hypothetical protein
MVVLDPFLVLVLVLVFYCVSAPAGRGGEGSGRLELVGCWWWLAWATASWLVVRWKRGASVVAVFVHRFRFPSRGGGRLSGLLQGVEALPSRRQAVRQLRRGLGAWGSAWIRLRFFWWLGVLFALFVVLFVFFFSLLDLLVKCVELPNICVGSFLKKKKKKKGQLGTTKLTVLKKHEERQEEYYGQLI